MLFKQYLLAATERMSQAAKIEILNLIPPLPLPPVTGHHRPSVQPQQLDEQQRHSVTRGTAGSRLLLVSNTAPLQLMHI
jgi:hypothetical protein